LQQRVWSGAFYPSTHFQLNPRLSAASFGTSSSPHYPKHHRHLGNEIWLVYKRPFESKITGGNIFI